MSGALKKFLPLFDRVLVERFMPETVTKGGIMLPEKAHSKILEATVVAVGPGGRSENGQTLPMSVGIGDKVMTPEYGGTKVSFDEKDFFLFRDSDLLGKFAS